MAKKILVISSGLVHPTLTCRRNLKRLLSGFKQMSCQFTSQIEDTIQLKPGAFDAVVLYYHRPHISDAALAALEDFVFNGGGLLAIHGASASFKDNQKYFNLLGGKFVAHGRITGFRVRAEPTTTGIFTGIKGFSVMDELYIHRYKEDITIHFTAENQGKREPVVWTRELGKGRIAYCSLGHCSPVLKNPHFGKIIYRSLRWVSRGVSPKGSVMLSES